MIEFGWLNNMPNVVGGDEINPELCVICVICLNRRPFQPLKGLCFLFLKKKTKIAGDLFQTDDFQLTKKYERNLIYLHIPIYI